MREIRIFPVFTAVLCLALVPCIVPPAWSAPSSNKVFGINTSNVVHLAGTLTELRRMEGPDVQAVYLEGRSKRGDGGGGTFLWDDSNLSAEVNADTQSGIYIAPDSDLTGASGAWVRQYNNLRPEYFGAKYNGMDDAEAVQAAFSFASPGSVIEFKGLSSVGSTSWVGLSLASKKDITIRGRGHGTGIKSLVAPSQNVIGSPYRVLLILINANNITIENMEIDGNSLANQLIGMESCNDCQIIGNYLHSTSGADYNGIYAVGGFRNKYIGNTVTMTGRGMWIGNEAVANQIESDPLIQNNNIYNCQATGIGGKVRRGRILGNNSSTNAGSGIVIGSNAVDRGEKTIVSGNTCRLNDFHGIQSDVVGNGYQSRMISVVGNICNENKQSGIYAVNVQDWTIVGNVCNDNNSDEIGSGYGISVGGTDGNSTLAKNVLIKGNICNNVKSFSQTSGIQIDAYNTEFGIDSVTISNNICENNSGFGIKISRASYGTLKNIVVSSNIVKDSGLDGLNISAPVTALSITGNIGTGSGRYDYYDTNLDVPIAGNYFTASIGPQITLVTNSGPSPSTGVGTVLMGTVTDENSAGWISFKRNGTTVYVPYWNTASP